MFETSDRIPETEYILELLVFGGVGMALNLFCCLTNQGTRARHIQLNMSGNNIIFLLEVDLDMNFEPSTEPQSEMWLLKVPETENYCSSKY